MKQKFVFERRVLLGLSSAVVLLLSIVIQAMLPGGVYANQITSRTLTLQGVGTTGGSNPGGTVDHQFTFTLPSSGTLGSIEFLYCTLPGAITDPCTGPTGLNTGGATLGTSTGAAFTSAVSTAANSIYITRTAAAFAGGAVTEQLLNVVNPTNVAGETFFVRIASYSSTDATTGIADTGTVAAATNRPIVLTGTMPESLVFCTGATVGTTSGVPDCSTVTTGAVGFSQLFSPTATSTASSQMAASTNAGSGYAITVNGPTMTSGGNTISAMAAAAASIKGISQFGMNLRANTTASSNPAVGIDVAPAANGTNYRGEPKPSSGYDVADTFKFNSTDTVADSANGGAGGTDAQIFTVSYIVNVPGSQPAGTYTTTLTYICTPTF